MTNTKPRRVQVIDSHTGGEPTRVVTSGGPDLGRGGLATRLERFRAEHDGFRSAVVNEPRGSDVVVGALLCEPNDTSCVAGMIFFNNVGYLGMCGHGTIGVLTTLAYAGLAPREYRRGVFEGSVSVLDGQVHPRIKGSAFVNAEATLTLDERDPFCWGIRHEERQKAKSKRQKY